jgi:hypothetical protein
VKEGEEESERSQREEGEGQRLKDVNMSEIHPQDSDNGRNIAQGSGGGQVSADCGQVKAVMVAKVKISAAPLATLALSLALSETSLTADPLPTKAPALSDPTTALSAVLSATLAFVAAATADAVASMAADPAASSGQRGGGSVGSASVGSASVGL